MLGRVPIGLLFKLPDWPGFHWVGLLISVMFDACFHLIIFTVAGIGWKHELPCDVVAPPRYPVNNAIVRWWRWRISSCKK